MDRLDLNVCWFAATLGGMEIDHDPEEPPYDRNRSPIAAPWPAAFVMLVLMWSLLAYTQDLDWISVLLGFLTAMLITAWFFDWHGTETPKSWRNTGGNRRSGTE